eukprot:618629-Prymnesium_polylepis.1
MLGGSRAGSVSGRAKVDTRQRSWRCTQRSWARAIFRPTSCACSPAVGLDARPARSEACTGGWLC